MFKEMKVIDVQVMGSNQKQHIRDKKTKNERQKEKRSVLFSHSSALQSGNNAMRIWTNDHGGTTSLGKTT